MVGIQLFHHGSGTQNAQIRAAFAKLAEQHHVSLPKAIEYTDDVSIFAVEKISSEAVNALSGFAGTQSIGAVPEYKLVRTQSRIIRSLSSRDLPAPEEGREYGVVGLIDAGTDRRNKWIRPWVIVRDDYWVPEDEQDSSHGTFVAGLLINGRGLNHGDVRFPGASSQIVDVVAVDRTGRIHESDLITILDYSLQKYPDVRVWNLSLALVGEERKLALMSRLGAALDARSQKHRVLFVVPTGNIEDEDIEMRRWPPQVSIGERDRMPPPGDSLLSLTVGGQAHDDNDATCVRREHVSPFALRGPGFGACMKPDVSHYAGNCDSEGHFHQTGILSVDEQENLAEDAGVSFAVPPVSTIAANVFQELSADPDSAHPVLVKALIVHSALISNPRFSIENAEYLGTGIPRDVPEILNCRKSSATIILQIPVTNNPEFTKRPSPMPKCLIRNGKMRADIFMTLSYQPPMEKRFGIEYCRTNISATLGTVSINPESKKEEYERQVPPALQGVGGLYPADVVELGQAWSPMKLYRRRFTKFEPNGIWRLKLMRLDRKELITNEPQQVFVIITIRDLDGVADVYGELLEEMQGLEWRLKNLELRSRPRYRDRQ